MNCKKCGFQTENNSLKTCPNCGEKFKKGLPVWAVIVIILGSLGCLGTAILFFLGIIAAMTMPTLVSNTDKARNRTAFLKTVSGLNQAIILTDAMESKTYTDSDDIWDKAVKPRLNIKKDDDWKITLADGVEITYEAINESCSRSSENEGNLNEDTACAILTIDTNGFETPPNKYTKKNEISDRFSVLLYPNVVVPADGSYESDILNGKDR